MRSEADERDYKGRLAGQTDSEGPSPSGSSSSSSSANGSQHDRGRSSNSGGDGARGASSSQSRSRSRTSSNGSGKKPGSSQYSRPGQPRPRSNLGPPKTIRSGGGGVPSRC